MSTINHLVAETTYFGVFISILFYWIGYKIQQRFRKPFLNPLLLTIVFVITFLCLFDIDYESYNSSARYLTYFLSPATVCLAVPLYKQLSVLRKNLVAVLVSIFAGCLAHFLVLLGLTLLLSPPENLVFSFLPKSVTTPIALGICNEIGGIEEITIIGVTFAGLLGPLLTPTILKLLHITNPIAQGLALGTASHAIGTSKAVEMGEVPAAMSSLAIVITGIMTVVLVPIYIQIFF